MNKKLLLLFFMSLGVVTMFAQKSLYDFKEKDIKGNTVNLAEYKGKVVLIVNTASKCGLTPQYEGLEALYKKYKDQGLVILGFPCNQFLGQEPGTSEEIATFCSVKYNVTFPLFEKIEVNGKKANSLYVYLKKTLPIDGNNDIRWNFEKFIIDRNGQPVLRFSPKTKPEDIEKDIVAALNKQ